MMAVTTGFYKDNTGYVIDKDPEATLSYLLDWTDWLPAGSVISTSNWTVETISGDNDNLTTTGNEKTDNTTSITLTGGTEGNIYRVYNTITTDGSQTDRRYFRVKIKSRSIE